MANKRARFINYHKRKGVLHIKLYDYQYTVLYENKVNLNDKEAVKKMVSDLKAKGFNLFSETSWF